MHAKCRELVFSNLSYLADSRVERTSTYDGEASTLLHAVRVGFNDVGMLQGQGLPQASRTAGLPDYGHYLGIWQGDKVARIATNELKRQNCTRVNSSKTPLAVHLIGVEVDHKVWL